MKSKISIIGRGVDPAQHLSLSALRTLRAADKIVGIESEKEFWIELQREFGIPEIEDLGSLYQSQDQDVVNYHRFIDYVLTISSHFKRLALLVAGHPRLGVSFIELLKKEASKDIEIEIIDGISSFDVMMTYLGIDPLEQGTTLVDANRLLLFQYKIEPALSYFIYHVCSVGNSKTNFKNPASNNRIDLLKKYLLKYYAEDKEVFLCRISNGKSEDSKLIRCRINELDNYIEKIDFTTTLYIPPEKPVSLDWNYLNVIR